MRTAALILALALAACGTTPPPEPIIRTVEVRVPVPVRCTPMLDPEPEYPDTDAALSSAGIFSGVAILKAAIGLYRARIAELHGQLRACAGE